MNDDHVEVSVQDQQALIERLTAERDALGKAIGDAAIGAGICRDDVPGLTGPQLLLLADDLRGTVVTYRARAEKAEGSLVQIGKDVADEMATCRYCKHDDTHIKVIVKRLRALGVEVAEVKL
jgi:hypothetical protein